MKTMHCILGAAFACLALLTVNTADAIPAYSIVSANDCDTCHIEPLGWANPDFSERRCTLDCVGCHVSNAGGGLRLADGQYFGKEVLPMAGVRPSSFADPEIYRPKGWPKKGRYDLGKGFKGWWAGKIDHTTIDERYGDIKAKPKWNIGGDFRAAALQQSTDAGSEFFIFPMQADIYLLNESVRDLQLYLNVGLQGYKDTDQYGGETEAIDYLAIKELFVKKRFNYYNSWVRAGRIMPRFGWRTPDHTAFTRQDLNFNQNFHAFGMEAGFNPNYLYADASILFPGLEWPGERRTRGIESTFNFGYRALGWHLGFSGHFFDENTGDNESENDGGQRQITAGLNWAINYNPVIYYGEIDFRNTSVPGSDADPTNGLVAHHELNYNATRGVYLKAKYDWADQTLNVQDDHKHRITLGADIHPYTFVHLEPLYRLGFGPDLFGTLTDAPVSEFMLITHVWF